MASTVHEERPSTSGATNNSNHHQVYPRIQRPSYQNIIRQPQQQQQWMHPQHPLNSAPLYYPPIINPMYMPQIPYIHRGYYNPPQMFPPIWRRPPPVVNVVSSVNRHIERDTQHPRPPGAPIGSTEPGGDCWNNAVVAWEQRTMIHNKIGLLVNERYKIVQNIDSGSYGTIFVAEDIKNNNNRVAVKFDAASKDDHLKYEYEVYKSALYDNGNFKIEGFPKVYWFGHEYGHNVLVMELLGPPIASLFNFCERKFGLQTVLALGEQMIRRIKHLHQRGFIHRDIKPENFLMGLNDNESICYLIDFGLARRYRYRDGRLLKHIPFRKGRSFVGTAKYASLNSHKNAELSRRDDVESLGYVLIELINGSLPWKKLRVRNAYSTKHQMYIKIKNMKEQTKWFDVCPSMAEWIKYCRELPFDNEPDYDFLLKLLRKVPEIYELQHSNSLQNITIDNIKCSQCKQRKNLKFIEMKFDKSLNISDDDKKQPENQENIRERKLSKSVSMSVVNTLDICQDGLTKTPTLKTFPESMSIQDVRIIDPKVSSILTNQLPDEETSSITSSCKKCRERRQKYFDDCCAETGKFSWQIWRESTPELKFHYENRFSWTINRPKYPQIIQNNLTGIRINNNNHNINQICIQQQQQQQQQQGNHNIHPFIVQQQQQLIRLQTSQHNTSTAS